MPLAPSVALRARLLPHEEWQRLSAIEPFKSRGLPDDPDTWCVLVVERFDEEGEPQIVGTCSLFTAMHWDCWFVDPAEPGAARGVVLRQLLRASIDILDRVGVQQAYCGAEADQPEIAELLTRFQFFPCPGTLFLFKTADAPAALRAETEGSTDTAKTTPQVFPTRPLTGQEAS